jgi:hypothetical protein
LPELLDAIWLEPPLLLALWPRTASAQRSRALLRGAAEAAAAEVEADLAAAEAELEAARAAQREAAGEEDVISPAHAFHALDD